MKKRKKSKRARRAERRRPRPAQTAINGLLHVQEAAGRPWAMLPLVLALAFVARAAIALSGDFVLHPDEIMQYLEPAHRLVFGSGVTYWEFFYGVRSWLLPGAVASLLKLFDAVGLGQPIWYIGGVKLAFCALSLVIPASMYFYARRSFSEATARVALLAGAFWYELAGFAHKPMTEFVATAPLLGLLAICARPALDNTRVLGHAALLAVLVAAIRLQYAPLALALLGIVFLRTGKKLPLALMASALFLAVGMFDALTWNSGLFHSYLTNLRFNLILGETLSGESPAYQFLWWLTLAGGGLSVLCLALALGSCRRYGLLLALSALLLLTHSLQAHKEYRFIFAIIPLWLLLGADLLVRAAPWFTARARWFAGLAAAVFTAVSLAGVLNTLPYQQQVYRAWSLERKFTGFVHNRDPIFAAYRYLARAPGVAGVWQVDRLYFNSPSYYYLHHNIPFYDVQSGYALKKDARTASSRVSHIVSEDPDLAVPGYLPDRQFGGVHILRREGNDAAIRQWREYAPVLTNSLVVEIMARIYPAAPIAPANAGIHLTGRERPAAQDEENRP